MSEINRYELAAYTALAKFWTSKQFPVDIPTFDTMNKRKVEHVGARFVSKESYIFKTRVIRIPIHWNLSTGTGIKMAITHDAVVFYYYFKGDLDDYDMNSIAFSRDNGVLVIAAMFDNSGELTEWFWSQLPQLLRRNESINLYREMSSVDPQVAPHKHYLSSGLAGRYTDARKMFAAADVQSLWRFINLDWIDVNTLNAEVGVELVVTVTSGSSFQYWGDGARTRYYMVGSVHDVSVNKDAGQAIAWLINSSTIQMDVDDIAELMTVTEIKERVIEHKKVGGTGNGQAVSLCMSIFMKGERQIRSYYRVTDESWSMGEDGDYMESTALFNDEQKARTAYNNAASSI